MKTFLMVNKLNLTVEEAKQAQQALFAAAPALEIIRMYLEKRIDYIESKLSNTEALYKEQGDCHARVATLLAKREELIKLYDKMTPVKS